MASLSYHYIHSKNPSIYAYIWLLMKGSKYLAGIVTSIYSLTITNPKYDCIVMVTDDVSFSTIKILKKICIVKKIPYIKNTIKLLTKRQKEKYSKWISVATTKWNCLNFTEYKKVLFLDADTIITKNIDHIFNNRTPAATFYNPWSNKFNKKSIIKDYYKNDKIISIKSIKKSLNGYGYVFIASTVLLTPNKQHFELFKSMIQKKLTFKNYSAPDETSLTFFYSLYSKGPRKTWINISDCYQFIPMLYKHNKCSEYKKISKNIKIMHIFGDLPWEMNEKHIKEYEDLSIWITFFRKSLRYFNINPKSVYMKYPNIMLNYKYNENNIYHKILKTT